MKKTILLLFIIGLTSISHSKEINREVFNSLTIVKNQNPKFIKFRIKNNSNNRNHFYVVGPKPDGSKFSYGFPMMPNSKRNENWSIGTKVYKVNGLGFKKLLIKIKKEDEGKTINLF